MRFIGCKTLLLDNIKEVIDEKAPDAKILCDVFSGTSTVARFFKQWYEVYSNDILYFSYVLQRGTVEVDKIPTFDKLKQRKFISDPIDYFNGLNAKEMEVLPRERRFFQNTYAPTGGRMYVNDENALRIDFARNYVEDWKKEGILSDDEYFYLLACIVEGIPFVSNISGTYGAFHKTWEKRSYKKYELFRLNIISNGRNNRCFNMNGAQMLQEVSGDILYIDPPYNNRQYLPNYHVLETAAKYDYPQVRGVTAQRPYGNSRSNFCLKTKAVTAFEELLAIAKFKHIILSYSTEGLMSCEEIERVMKKYGKSDTFQIYWIPYRRYKSREQGKKEQLKEMLVYIER